MSARKKAAKRRTTGAAAARDGKIITFYSYKGGTGRSLAVANVAWILADSGKKVLVIDWDLEAPGLHRYFHPFLDDKHLVDTPGIIDFLSAFVEGSRHEHAACDRSTTGKGSRRWFEKYLNYFPYALSLRVPGTNRSGKRIFRFRRNGILDFMPAGRQDAGYSVKVTRFDWEEFYDQLGGGVFLQCFKKALRQNYDYILIDSRTGISDTSGICTVQMPDDLVVCFTYNSQSIIGAEAAARSALAQRLRPSGEPSLRIWPVPTRVDGSEHKRLDAARLVARQTFQHFLVHLPRKERQRYWDGIEVPYAAYLAFEEILAPFADRSRSKLSILDSMCALANAITDGSVKNLPTIPEMTRRKILLQFERAGFSGAGAPRDRGSFYLSYAAEDRSSVESLGRMLNDLLGEGSVAWDTQLLRVGDSWPEVLGDAMRRAKAVLVAITDRWLAKDQESQSKQEAVHALKLKKRVVPILLGVEFSALSKLSGSLTSLGNRQGFLVSTDSGVSETDVRGLATQLLEIQETVTASAKIDVDDPQRGQWGGKAEANGRKLRASVERTDDEDWFEIELEVLRTDDRPLSGVVDFYLHPTFVPARRRVKADGERATLTLNAYGAFTVGVETDDGATQLEMNLASLQSAPREFRIH